MICANKIFAWLELWKKIAAEIACLVYDFDITIMGNFVHVLRNFYTRILSKAI